MNLLAREALTIGSTITPPGLGGVSVIRLSGKDATTIVRKLADFLPQIPESHRIYYGFLKDHAGQSKIDEVLLSYFAKNRSFTGEETIEISHHGSPLLSQTILEQLSLAGMSLAVPGEFTFRAFFNKRIDLVQAEAVLDLIEAKSQRSSRLALRQLEGGLSTDLMEYEGELLGVLAHLEANLDFAQEDIEVAPRLEIKEKLVRLKSKFANFVNEAPHSKILREGFRVALVGAPNVGKSSLLNAICRKDLAIVSDIPGTTRDPIFGDLMLGGYQVHFFDTAGLRTTEDKIEKLGIERTFRSIDAADQIFHILDASDPTSYKDIKLLGVPVFNKVDLVSGPEINRLKQLHPDSCFISAKSLYNLESLFSKLSDQLKALTSEESSVLFQARHFEAFQKIVASLSSSIELIEDEASDEFIIAEVQEALISVFEILGKRFDDEVLDRVFKEFCLGK